MKINNLLLLLLAASLLFNFIQWRSHPRTETVIEGKFITVDVPAGTDTKPRPAPASRKKTDTTAAREVVRRYDSTEAAIRSLPPAAKDSAKGVQFGKFQIQVRDSFATLFISVDPLAPIENRATLDSIQYKALHWEIPYFDTTTLVKTGTSVTGYLSAAAGAVIGGSVAGPPGAGVGALLGLGAAEILKED